LEPCRRQGCGGRIAEGFCTVCGLAPEGDGTGPLPASPGPQPPAGKLLAGVVAPVDLAGPAHHDEWEVTVVVDPSLDADPDPGHRPPADAGERLFLIYLPEMLVGRRDDSQRIRPEIPVLDPGVSRRHASFLQLPGGRLAILDLASANGTVVNGARVVAGARRELADGDAVTMGRWTRITVRRRNRAAS
jgi:hypothetical protein